MAKKTLLLVLSGNILDYYDFLLFAHLGYLILPIFTPAMDTKQSHLLGLFLFALVFIVRPAGAYLFGRISDLENRRKALSQSVLWSGIATFALAFLPSYETIGILSTVLLILCRTLQGMSLGGEYPTAGTYLMETYPKHRGLLSGILAASTSVGSLIALCFAWICLQENAPSWLWRAAFFLGGLASLISYFLRKNLKSSLSQQTAISNFIPPTPVAIMSTLFLGMLLSVFSWLPVTYINFFLTKILNHSTELGLSATLLAIIPAFFLKPLFGKLSDRYPYFSYLSVSSFLSIPLVLIGFSLIIQANILGQIPLIIAATLLSGPVHAVMNSWFKQENRSRFINLFFMLGAGIGGLVPSLSGFVVAKTGFHFFPAIICASIGMIAGATFLYFSLTKRVI